MQPGMQGVMGQEAYGVYVADAPQMSMGGGGRGGQSMEGVAAMTGKVEGGSGRGGGAVDENASSAADIP